MLITRMNIAISALLISSFLIGCSNLKAVGKFADGAQMLSEASAKLYDSELEMNRKLAIIGAQLDFERPDPDTIDPKCRAINEKSGKVYYLTAWDCATKNEIQSEVRRKSAAVASLAQYAQSLKEIAEYNDDQNVEKSAKELSGNLSALAKTLDATAKIDESTLATAISEVAKIYIDLKVRNTVHQKAKLAQEHVSLIVNTLKRDINSEKNRLYVYRNNAKAVREEWFKTYRHQYLTNKELTLKDKTTNSEKNRLNYENSILSIAAGTLIGDELNEQITLGIGRLKEQKEQESDEHSRLFFLKKLNQTADSCLEAHRAIQEPNIKETSGAIIKFINDAKFLQSSVKQLSK